MARRMDAVALVAGLAIVAFFAAICSESVPPSSRKPSSRTAVSEPATPPPTLPLSVRIPLGTPQPLIQAVIAAFDSPEPAVMLARPGWIYIERTPQMERIAEFGKDAIPVLTANLGNKKLKYTALKLLGDLRAANAHRALTNEGHGRRLADNRDPFRDYQAPRWIQFLPVLVQRGISAKGSVRIHKMVPRAWD